MPPLAPLHSQGQRPPPGTLRLNTGHTLAAGLIACFLFNDTGSNTVFEAVNGLSLQLLGGATWGISPSGGVGGLVTNVTGARAEILTPDHLKVGWPATLVWRGQKLGTQDINSVVFGVTYDNANASPYEAYEIGVGGSNQPQLFWSYGAASFTQIFMGSVPANGPLWMAGTMQSGAQFFYVNNPYASVGSLATVGAPQYSSTSLIAIGGQTGATTVNSGVLHEVAHIYERVLSADELAMLHADPYCMWQTRRLWYVAGPFGPPPQKARPSADVTTAGWQTQAGATTNLYTVIDEADTPNDADYIISTAANPQTLVGEVQLSSTTDPASSTGHTVRIRAAVDQVVGGTVSLLTELRQGTAALSTPATWTDTLTGAFQTFAHTLSGAQTDAITDYTTLRLRWTATQAAPAAVTFIGAGTAAWTATNSATFTPTIVNGAVGDLLLMIIERNDTTTAPTITGWTNVPSLTGTNSTTQSVAVYTKVATSATGSADQVAVTFGTSTVARGGVVLRFRGQDGTTPIVNSSKLNVASTATTVSTTAISPAVANTLGVFVAVNIGSRASGSTPSGWATFASQNTTVGNDLTVGYTTRAFAATGSYGSPSTTWATNTTTGVGMGLLIALQPVVNASKPEISWAEVEIPAVTGPASYFPAIAASVGITSAAARQSALARSIGASAPPSILLNVGQGYTRPLNASASASSAETRTLSLVRAPSTSIATSSAATRLAALVRKSAPSVAFSASLARASTLARTWISNVSATANLIRTSSLQRKWTPSIAAGASASRAGVLGRTVASTVSTAASLLRTVGFQRNSAPSITASASVARASTPARNWASNVSALVSLARTVGLQRKWTPSMAASASVSRSTINTRTLASAIAATAAFGRATAFARSISASRAQTAALGRAVAFARSISPSVVNTAAVARTLTLSRKITPTIAQTALVSRVVSFARASSSSVTVQAAAVRAWSGTRGASASVAHATATVRHVVFARALSTALASGTVLSRAWTGTRTLSASLANGATLARTWSTTRALTASAAHAATLLTGHAYSRTFNTVTSASAAVGGILARGRAISTSIGHIATFARRGVLMLAASAATAFAASISRTAARVRTSSTSIAATYTFGQSAAHARVVAASAAISSTVVAIAGHFRQLTATTPPGAALAFRTSWSRLVSASVGLTSATSVAAARTRELATSIAGTVDMRGYLGSGATIDVVVRAASSVTRAQQIARAAAASIATSATVQRVYGAARALFSTSSLAALFDSTYAAARSLASAIDSTAAVSSQRATTAEWSVNMPPPSSSTTRALTAVRGYAASVAMFASGTRVTALLRGIAISILEWIITLWGRPARHAVTDQLAYRHKLAESITTQHMTVDAIGTRHALATSVTTTHAIADAVGTRHTISDRLLEGS